MSGDCRGDGEALSGVKLLNMLRQGVHIPSINSITKQGSEETLDRGPGTCKTDMTDPTTEKYGR